jgi:ribose transport system ATP-binding protein
MAETVLRMTDICKSYSGVQVLKNVNVEFTRGEIHALLGENGAGKTTLMNILGAVIDFDKGTIEVNGKVVHIHNPGNSQALGIAFIHQELNVVNDLMVYENMFLGYELKDKFGRLDAKEMVKKTEEVFAHMHVQIDPRAMVRNLEASYKQIIEIAKALLRDARIIIMDEPTTSLTTVEIKNVFEIMRTLRSKGVTLIFISHKLGEVVDICDRFTVLRNGEKVVDGDINGPDGKIAVEDLARYMVGRDVLSVDVYQKHEIGEVVLEVEKLNIPNHVHDVSFNLRRGEILGFTGLLGDGRTELARCLFGDIKYTSGHIKKDGKNIRIKSPKQAKKLKIGYVPSNRKENGIVKDLTVMENITLATLEQFTHGTTLNHRDEAKMADFIVGELQIKVADIDNLITSLSGGNQQKVVLAKWLNSKPDILMFSNPTQGVDVGAKNEIYRIIMELAKTGVAIIVTSGEAQEIIKICDRSIIMYHGRIRGEIDRSECTEESLMILSTGGSLS